MERMIQPLGYSQILALIIRDVLNSLWISTQRQQESVLGLGSSSGTAGGKQPSAGVSFLLIITPAGIGVSVSIPKPMGCGGGRWNGSLESAKEKIWVTWGDVASVPRSGHAFCSLLPTQNSKVQPQPSVFCVSKATPALTAFIMTSFGWNEHAWSFDYHWKYKLGYSPHPQPLEK